MTINEILKAQGIPDEKIKDITEAMKANKVYTASEENLDIRYGKTKTEKEGLEKQLSEANTLIENLKKSNKGNEDLQSKVTAYESQVAQLQTELQQARIDSAIKVGLLEEKALDLDYMAYKIKSGSDPIELNEDGKIKGWRDRISALRTAMPNQFAGGAGGKTIIENKLPDNNGGSSIMTRSEILKKPYAERAKMFEENPEAFRTAMANN